LSMVWTHIILEAYCARKWSTTRSKYLYKRLKNGSFEKVENKNYDSNYRTPRKPGYCENTPNYACLEKNCPHLAYANAEEPDYKLLDKKYKKRPKNTMTTASRTRTRFPQRRRKTKEYD